MERIAYVLVLILAAFVPEGCSLHRSPTATTAANATTGTTASASSLQIRGQAYADKVKDMLKDYTDDEGNARYEEPEIAAVQKDLDDFDIDSPDLEYELYKMYKDMQALHARDEDVNAYRMI